MKLSYIKKKLIRKVSLQVPVKKTARTINTLENHKRVAGLSPFPAAITHAWIN